LLKKQVVFNLVESHGDQQNEAMKKNTTYLTTFTALAIAFLVTTTACIPAGNETSANEGDATTQEIDSLTFNASATDADHEANNEEQFKVEVDHSGDENLLSNIVHEETNEEVHAHLHPQLHDEKTEISEELEEADNSVASLRRYLMKDYSSSPGQWSEDVMNLQSILGIAQDGVYGLQTREAHLDALRERNLATDGVPALTAFEKNLEQLEQRVNETKSEIPCSGITCFDGYEGDNQAAIDAAAAALPAALAKAISGVTVVNGCHPFGKVQLGHCAYGTWDSAGWDSDGEHGNEWAMTVWVSNRGVNSGHLTDIMTHEAGHVYSYVVARKCNNPETGKSYREEARTLFGGEEPFADAITAYFTGGSFQHYRGHGAELSDGESAFLAEMIESC